jgi:predicted metal-dependent phosphoesterase TrpH
VTVDLHVHTTSSDGNRTSGQVVALALEAGLSAIAITDHDSVEGVEAALTAASVTPLRVVPGVELSASAGELDAHILGYFVDVADPTLLTMLAGLRATRLARAEAMVDALKAAGYVISIEQVVALAEHGGAVGRSHVARALVESGQVASVDEVFRTLIGRNGRFYVSKPLATPRQAVETIRAAGGVAVLAHPGINGTEVLLDELVACGLRGIEVNHPEHPTEQREHFARVAGERGLIATGGSDYHGPGSVSAVLGAAGAPDGVVEELAASASPGRA